MDINQHKDIPESFQNPLLIFYSNLSESSLQNYVINSNFVEIKKLPQWDLKNEWLAEVNFEIPNETLKNSQELIPSFSSLTSNEFAYQFSIKAYLSDDTQTSEYYLASIGKTDRQQEFLHPTSNSGSSIGVEIDLFAIKNQIKKATLTLRIVSSEIEQVMLSPCILSLQTVKNRCTGEISKNQVSFEPISLKIPSISQMVQDAAICHRICSPTNVAMLLQSFGIENKLSDVLNNVYNSEHDMYGIWPANIWAASRWGVLGYIANFSSWKDVEFLLKKNIPIIASIRYKQGELTGAAVEETSGHLVTIRGFENQKILVNDPAAPSPQTVQREYDLDEFTEVWMRRIGIGYVLFPGSWVEN